ncbi:MAG TPA: DUF456 domain-containing protein [Bacteroidia bacterium]|nr:DUF456 domain-containing protein [Bacteroidia bacterium]
MSDLLLLSIGVVLNMVGIAGCIIPGLPGPPISYLSLLIIQWQHSYFSTTLLIVLGILTMVVLMADYFIPIWTGKKFGATKQGIRGSIIGMFIGIFLTPIGMIAGLIAGSILGDLSANRTLMQAGTAGIGVLFGTLLSIGIKLMICGVLFFYFIKFALSIL